MSSQVYVQQCFLKAVFLKLKKQVQGPKADDVQKSWIKWLMMFKVLKETLFSELLYSATHTGNSTDILIIPSM